MIKTLHISNFALIDELNVQFGPTFNVITGETGAGKSVMMGALGLLLGNRADVKSASNGNKTVIEAVFDTTGYTSIKESLAQSDVEWDDNECILRREILPGGRTRAFINDTPVTLTLLKQVATQLVDIHSQHQNLLLASPGYQLQVLDAISDNAALRHEYATQWQHYRKTLANYKQSRQDIAAARANEEYVRFQLEQLTTLNPVKGEQEELERERDVITNLSQVKACLATIAQAMSEGEPNIMTLLKSATGAAAELASTMDDTAELAQRLEALSIEARDIADTYTAIDRNIDADPSRLEYIDQRLDEIYDLQRRHNVDSIDGLIAVRDKLQATLNASLTGDEQLQELEEEVRKARRASMATARQISKTRTEAAQTLASKLKDTALPLGMKNLRCEIAVTQGELSPDGIDSVQFLFAFNKNQPLMPVGDTASGGEISRLMLTLKTIIASHMQLPSVIFDEVDTGVSGDVASRMGQMMRQMSEKLQVITITHLPQVASLADTHFKVYKEDSETATSTHVKQLDNNSRIEEIAAMLSADHVDSAARANARSLLGNRI